MNRLSVLTLVLILVLLGSLSLVLDVQQAKSDYVWTETIYIRADGSVDPAAAPVSSADNVTYRLTDSIIGSIPQDVSAIVIERNNTVLGGEGYVLQGANAWNSVGVMVSGRSNITIENMEILSFQYGVVLELSSSNNSVNGNNITANFGHGVWLRSSSSFNSISGNNITNNEYGVFLDHVANTSVSGNNIIDNEYGAELDYSFEASLYHNNFIGNTHQVRIFDNGLGYPNMWDDGYPSGGNYWSDYIGVDAESGPFQNETGSDGMGDTPYVLDANNQDNYPLMKPWPSGWKLDFAGPTKHPIVDFAVYGGSLYAAADNKLYVKEGGIWSTIDAPTFVTSLEPYGGKLVVGGQGGLYCYDGTGFNLVFSLSTYIKVFGVCHGRLWAGTMLDKPPKLYYCNGSPEDPANWHMDTDFSTVLNFSSAFGSIDSFEVFNGIMYVSCGGKMYSFNGIRWSAIASCDDVFAFLDMQVYNGKLYLATKDQPWREPLYQGGTGFSGRVIEFDGENWTTILDYDYWIYSLGIYADKLCVGTANKILTYNGMSWEVSFNATQGAYYALCFENYYGGFYVGMGNGYVHSTAEALASLTLFEDSYATWPATAHDWDGVSEGGVYEWAMFVYNTGSMDLYVTYLPTNIWFDDNQTHLVITVNVVKFGIPGQLSDVTPVVLPETDPLTPTNGYFLPATKMIKLDFELFIESRAPGAFWDWSFLIYGSTGGLQTWTNEAIAMHAGSAG